MANETNPIIECFVEHVQMTGGVFAVDERHETAFAQQTS